MKFFLTALLLLATIVAVSTIGIGRKQSVGAKGRLTCHGKPARGVKVKLYDDDRGLDTDDHIATTKSDGEGRFEVSGSEDEITSIDPKLNVYHDCDDEIQPCQRKITIVIPDSYISSGKSPKKLYDAGTIELSGKLKDRSLTTYSIYQLSSGEERDCIN